MPALLFVKKVDAPIPDGVGKWYAQDPISVIESIPEEEVSQAMKDSCDLVYIEDMTVEEAREAYLSPQTITVMEDDPVGEFPPREVQQVVAQRVNYTKRPAQSYIKGGIVRDSRPINSGADKLERVERSA